jgi:transposase InsO family protein
MEAARHDKLSVPAASPPTPSTPLRAGSCKKRKDGAPSVRYGKRRKRRREGRATRPTLTFGILYCFFVIAHDRRRILCCNVTRHPSSAWVVQQMRETFPYDSVPGYLLFDRGSNFNAEVVSAIQNFGIQPKRTSFRSPWQNGVAERWVGSCRDLLDHVIVLNEQHLKRLMREYLRYYHDDRTHLGLEKETPSDREPAKSPNADCTVISMPRLGGLHHRYNLAA